MVMPDQEVFAKPWVEFCEEFGEPPRLDGPLENLYKGWEKILSRILALYEIPAPDKSVQTKDVKIHDDVSVRVYTPPGAQGSEKLGVYFHGGGWVLGSVELEDPIARLICKSCNMVVVSVEYRMAPMHKFPAALDDCVAAVKWALSNASSIGADGKGAVLIGQSAGGGLAFSTALRLIDEGRGNEVAGIAAVVPVTVHPDAVPSELKSKYTSYDEHAEHTVNTKNAMLEFLQTYGAPADDKYTSPLLHSRLKDLPNVYMTESGADTLRDDARLMKDALEQAGVKVKYDDFPGYPHYSWTFPSKLLSEHQQDFFGKMIQGISWAAGSGV